MVATVGVVAVLLMLLALPDFASDHLSLSSPLVVLALCLAMVQVLGVVFSLALGEKQARLWLWISVAAYVVLLGVEPFILLQPLRAGSTPWLLAVSLIAFAATTLAEPRLLRAGLVCAGIDIALFATYAGRVSISHSIIDAIGLGLIAVALIAGVKGLRSRADRADLAESAAQLLFENQQRQTAMEAERVHTDAILHDSLLASLLAAAGHEAPDRASRMAESALDIITRNSDHPVMQPATTNLGRALMADAEMSRLRGLTLIKVVLAGQVELPTDVATALVSAAGQAVTNSVKHAGPAALCTVAVTALDSGGTSIIITDDGAGFDLAHMDQQRLGVRVSILERVRQAGGHANISSSPGNGTQVYLEWRPLTLESATTLPPALTRLSLIPRRQLSRILTAVIVMTILTAISETTLFSRAIGPVVAAVLGLIILPAVVRGARTGTMRARTSWAIGAVGLALCATATIGLDPASVDCVSIYWYTCGILGGAVMMWMSGRKAVPIMVVSCQVAQISFWAGPTGAIRLGLAAEIVLVIAGLIMHRAIRRINIAAEVAAAKHRDLTIRQAEIAAFHLERQQRLQHAAATAEPMLRLIISCAGQIGALARAECRVLEQALRDEIRGRSLLNDAIRNVVSDHRRRGAYVQILDDGGLEDIDPHTREDLLNDTARRIKDLQSTRIVIRTGQPDSETAITIVATTTDETAVALGLDSDDDIDLWATIPRPSTVTLAA